MVKTVRTREIDDRIIEGLSEGIPLAQLCRELKIGLSTVYDWRDADPEFSGRFARAREIGFDAIAMDALRIQDEEPELAVNADGSARRDSAFVAWQKNRVETRLKLLAKWDPKRYGDKQLLGSDPENPLPPGNVLDVSKLSTGALRELMAARGETDKR